MATIGLIIFIALYGVGYLIMIASFIYRKVHPRPTPRIIAPHEVEPRLNALIAMGLPADIADPVARGQKINAIKAYRETYDVGLKYAKDAVEAWEIALRAAEQARQSDR